MRIPTDAFSWRQFANVAGVCLVLSTQVLVQPDLLDLWSSRAILRGWFDSFVEIFLCGMAMWVLVMLAVPAESGSPARRALTALAALAAGAVLGSVVALGLLQPPGFYPTLPAFAGDALRWAIFGALVYFAYDHLRRAARDATAIAEARATRESLERQVMEAQLDVLRAQIEPHFLFNTLAHVKRLYGVRPETGGEMLTSLRHYLAAALPRMREEGSTLGSEVEFARAYLNIVRIRLGARLAAQIDVPEGLLAWPLPPMMLITLVENAVKHGIAPSEEGGTVAIRARVDSGFLEVDIADTGVGFRGSEGGGVGLANVRARLRALHGATASLALCHNRPRGVISRLRIPLPKEGGA
jgi:hypothetical protein